jgi:DNA-binding FadR family transcriptional regulator
MKLLQPSDRQNDSAGESVEARAFDELHRRLTVGHYAEGRLPPERRLAEELGIGRRALRQALAALEQEGLIWRRQGHGTFVSTHPMASEADIARLANRVSPIEVVEARLSIEPMLVGRSALRVSKAAIDQMRRLTEAARIAADARTYETFDMAFHRKIAEGAGNALFLAIFEMVISVREMANWRRVREYYFEHDGAELSYREHKLIIEAIADRDPPRAEAMMREHLSQVAKIVLGAEGPAMDALVNSIS